MKLAHTGGFCALRCKTQLISGGGILLALFEWQINLQSKNFKHLNARRPVIISYTQKVLNWMLPTL